ncbi:neuropeptide CCHamide-2 isoform X2 [Haematobia irritans]|uniref:Putative neuropeptide cchamide-2 n=1 Tax=Haematobia irritans TaxID=7368 RepID=A0A1L8EGP6_HAEIR
MKLSISFFLVVICTMCLAAQQSQAKKGCNAYGYACYGGHGKRSLNSPMPDMLSTGPEQNDLNQLQQQTSQQHHPNSMFQMYPSEANVLIDGDLESYPRYRLIKIMKSWFGNTHRRPSAERLSDMDYPLSGEMFNHENNPPINNNHISY